MRGIVLKDSIKLFGFKSGFGFWFRWSFVNPIEMFYWLNISHKPYCTYSGFYCKNENCGYKHLLTKKEIKKHWTKTEKEMNTVEKGKNGKCVYCGENKGITEIDNPNPDKLNKWLVCMDCYNIIENQQKLCFSQIIGDAKGIEEAQNKLLEISQRTGKPSIQACIEKDKDGKYHSSSITFTGDKQKGGKNKWES